MRKVLMALLISALATPLMAQGRNCAPRQAIVDRLANGFSESRQAIGIGSNNSVVEIFASEMGSWSITVTSPNGLTCLVAAGQSFEVLAEAYPVPEDDPT
jgi:hypothetical protein